MIIIQSRYHSWLGQSLPRMYSIESHAMWHKTEIPASRVKPFESNKLLTLLLEIPILTICG